MARRIKQHSDLSQRARDADILSAATTHAVKCRDALVELSNLVRNARLAQAYQVSLDLLALIQSAPEPLPRANIFSEIKVFVHPQTIVSLVLIIEIF